MDNTETDVVVVGAGNAGLVAALAARERGARVILLESASEAERGGNSRFSGGIFRTVHSGTSGGDEPIDALICQDSKKWLDRVSVGPYTQAAYRADWLATSRNRPDRTLVDTVIDDSYGTLTWMAQRGVEWELTVGKLIDPDNIDPDQTYTLPPGGAVRARHEGIGLVASLFAAAEAAGVDIWYEAPAAGLITRGSTVDGVRVRLADRDIEVRGTVVLASGGFEANPEMRLRYLGTGWDTVKVRGSRFNMGTMLTQALLSGAAPAGHWEGCHAAPIDAGGPPVGDLRLTDKLSRYSYPYALLVNANGERFLDEGENEVWLTYAKTGSAVRAQPTGVAYQVFDRKTIHLLEPRYRTGTPIVADSLAELAGLIGIDAESFTGTVAAFNDAVAPDAGARFDPFTKDGLAARPAGQPPKSNWAQRIDEPPYTVYPVSCGITFTYGGLKVDSAARVLDTEGRAMPGLYATGEIIGDLFYYNYAAGAGLVRGAVFGRIAGGNAAGASRTAGS